MVAVIHGVFSLDGYGCNCGDAKTVMVRAGRDAVGGGSSSAGEVTTVPC